MNGVSFGEIHSYNDLHLILAPFTPAPAKPQTNFLKVPGRDGSLDLTEANGEVKFNDRTFSFTFTIVPGDDLTFDERVSKVSAALNGKRCKITLDRDPGYYWLGRCVVDQCQQNKRIGKIVVKATVQPYKLKQGDTISNHYGSGDSDISITLNNDRMPAIPTIYVRNSGATVTFLGVTYDLASGANKILDIRLTEGENNLVVSGTDEIQFIWQEGAL